MIAGQPQRHVGRAQPRPEPTYRMIAGQPQPTARPAAQHSAAYLPIDRGPTATQPDAPWSPPRAYLPNDRGPTATASGSSAGAGAAYLPNDRGPTATKA